MPLDGASRLERGTYVVVIRLGARVLVAAALFSAVVSGASALQPVSASAASCVQFVAGHFDARGDDNYNLNNEWVRIKNKCAASVAIGGWTINDTPAYHVYRFRSGVTIAAGQSITLYSGRGADTATKKYWGYQGSAVWNNDGDKAVLKNAAGKVQSTLVGP
jgi:hypothetical protein